MNERPILFSGAMVRAILDGRKTQTRRVVKGVNRLHNGVHISDWPLSDPPVMYEEDGLAVFTEQTWVDDNTEFDVYCPYGKPSDRLWVRETWAALYSDHSAMYGPLLGRKPSHIAYRGDHADPNGDGPDNPMPWRPSIHMPRWASRITLEVTGVRVERVQDISEADAEAEGTTLEEDHGDCIAQYNTHRLAFSFLWDRINAKRGYGWDANPWVWVVEFRRVQS